jgi:tetratricopeptide (TPR) repeat protein
VPRPRVPLIVALAVCLAPPLLQVRPAAARPPAEEAQPAARAPDLADADRALAAGRYAEAEAAYRALAEGGDGRARLGLGRVQLATGRYAEAAATAARVTGRRKLAAAAHTLRGEALSRQGKLDAAEAAFRRALRDPRALRARVLLGRLLVDRGRADAARPLLLELIEVYNDDELGPEPAATLAYVAMAARTLGSAHDANDAFREAALADRSRVETQLQWARLFLDKYDQRHAAESVQEALEHNPRSPEAHVLAARLVLLRSFDFPEADGHLKQALEVNPNLVSAHVTRATMALRNMDIEAADGHLKRALTINPRDLEALSVRAAARFLDDDERGFARAKREVLTLNPRFSRMYSIIAEYAEWEHRYDELIEMARAALEIDPDDALAHATLGHNLLRTGQEEAGLRALNEAWARDHFNVHVYNTLNLYDEVISKDYVRHEVPPFRIRMLRDERPVLDPYLAPMLRRAYEDMVRRYRFTPQGPLDVELYADRQHFSVRTTGLPNVGVQGVCFGKVITALSPRGGQYNWGQITWHELAHVFHLQLSKNHVPRWFTEGLAEYETIIARPEWRREEDPQLWEALREDRVPRLRDMNRAFTGARSPQALMTAYYAASQAVVYIVERFGFEKVRPMLVAWGQGKRTAAVVEEVLGLSIDALDRDFRAHLKERLARYDAQFHVDWPALRDLEAARAAAAARPDDVDAQAALAMSLVAHDEYLEAKKVGGRVLKADADNALAHFALTRVALEENEPQRAARCLQAIIDGGQDGYILRVLLSRAALARGKPREALEQAEAAARLDPDQMEAYRVMLDVGEKLEDDRVARRALTELARLDQHDRLVHFALLTMLNKQKDWDALVAAGETALYVDPENSQVHRLLGEAYLRKGRPSEALTELDQALRMKHPRSGRVQLLRAEAFMALGQRKRAAEAARKAKKADAKLSQEAERVLHVGDR